MVDSPAIFTLILTLLVLLDSTLAENSTHYDQASCGGISLQYPFGFSQGSPIKLNCTNETIRIGDFQVQNVTPKSIFILIPPKCNRPLQSTITPLFGHNYALTKNNSLLLQNCTSVNGSCVVPTSFVTDRVRTEGCDERSDNITCFSRDNTGVDVLSRADVNGAGCRFLFSAMSVSESIFPAVSLEFQIIELAWWVEGSHECSPNASSVEVKLADGKRGYRCHCNKGFFGDGFKNGTGCRRDSDCSPSKYMSGHCGGTTRVAVLVGGLIIGASVMAGLSFLCYSMRRRSTCLRSRMNVKRLVREAMGNPSVPFYPYKDIERATNSFSEKQRLGTGAFGTVYAGKLYNDEWVAIKKIKHRDTNSIDQVLNEIKLLSSVSHPNLVRLLGCCIEEGEQILVYEFMPNGTLSQHLQRKGGKVLPWTIRLTIAAETAHAIAYLHSAMNPPIYHRDIKSSNILLDYNFNSKVADFGLSRLGMVETSHISTAPQGTPGYVDPQYHQNFHLSDKSDVYSFGVVLVEIISALKVVDFARPQSEVNLAALAADRIRRGCVDEIIDPFIEPHRDAWTTYSIHKVAELAFRCLAFHSDMRPSMMEVAEELEHIRCTGWATVDENLCMASSVGSSCSSPHNGSEKSFRCLAVKKGGVSSRRLIVPQKMDQCPAPLAEEKDTSPVSVQDPWLSGHSSPSTNSLLGNAIQ